MRKATYGERMQEFEKHQDESYWRRKFENALNKHDYLDIEELIKEALIEEYYIPLNSDPKILEIINRLKNV